MNGRKTADREEQESIVTFAAMLLSQNMTTADVKRQLALRYAEFSFSTRTLERYVARAKEKVAELSGLEARQVRGQVVAMLQGLLHGRLSVWERLAVIDRLIMLFGLNAPHKFAETNPDGSALSDEERDTFRKSLLARLGVGPAAPNPGGPNGIQAAGGDGHALL